MKLLILTLDTGGDVQPFVALPRGLANAGHEAVLAAPHRFEGFVRDQGVPFARINDCLVRRRRRGPAMMFGRTVDRWRDVGPAATPWPA